jgi:hypothetical protein
MIYCIRHNSKLCGTIECQPASDIITGVVVANALSVFGQQPLLVFGQASAVGAR